jgi:hypothetical protein
VYLLVFHAYFYWEFEFLKGSLRDAFISRSALKGLIGYTAKKCICFREIRSKKRGDRSQRDARQNSGCYCWHQGSSTPKKAGAEHSSHSTVRWNCRKLLYSYYMYQIQGQNKLDYLRKAEFCVWPLHQFAIKPVAVLRAAKTNRDLRWIHITLT